MKTSNITTILITILFTTFLLAFAACSSSDDETYPEITDNGITANPIDCQVYQRGDSIPFCYVFTDDTELGAYNIEIHHNFDHHTHSTSPVECAMEAQKKTVNPWVFNQDYTIPAGLRTYTSRIYIPIPSDVDAGDYHFMIRLTDRAGWQQLKAVAIKIM